MGVLMFSMGIYSQRLLAVPEVSAGELSSSGGGMIRQLLVLSTIVRLVLFLALTSSAMAMPGIQSGGLSCGMEYTAVDSANTAVSIRSATVIVSGLHMRMDGYVVAVGERRPEVVHPGPSRTPGG